MTKEDLSPEVKETGSLKERHKERVRIQRPVVPMGLSGGEESGDKTQLDPRGIGSRKILRYSQCQPEDLQS